MELVAITVAGTTGVGKTSIARKLESVLKEYGIKTTVIDYDEGVPEIEKCLKAIGDKKIQVVINVVQVRRGR